MPDFQVGDTVEVQEAATRKKEAEIKTGKVVFVGRKFASVNVGNYVESCTFDQLTLIKRAEEAV